MTKYTRFLLAGGLALLGLMPLAAETATANPRALFTKKNPVFNLQDVDVKPEPLERAAPGYPKDLRAQRIGAKVVVEFIIGKDGDVVTTAIFSSTDERFNATCLEAVRKWKFKPAQKKGKQVNCRASQLLEFSP